MDCHVGVLGRGWNSVELFALSFNLGTLLGAGLSGRCCDGMGVAAGEY
jgi:hypothetical protein